jgi:hypothetical protein
MHLFTGLTLGSPGTHNVCLIVYRIANTDMHPALGTELGLSSTPSGLTPKTSDDTNCIQDMV